MILAREKLDLGKLVYPESHGTTPNVLGFIAKWFEHDGAGLRDIEQQLGTLCSICSVWPHQVEIQLIILLPLIRAFHGDQHSITSVSDIEKAILFPSQNFSSQWNVTYYKSGNPVQIDIRTIPDRLWKLAQSPLQNFSFERNGADWSGEQLGREIHTRFSRTTPRNGECSHMLEYPIRVRQAGRVATGSE